MSDPWCTADRHDTSTAYWHGCRCETARRARSSASRRLRRRRAYGEGPQRESLTGTSRRLQALAVAGWTCAVLAPLVPVAVETMRCWVRGAFKGISCEHAAQVRALYEERECTPGPSWRAAGSAVRKGWVGPERWFGLDMDDPDIHPLRRQYYQRADLDEVVVSRLLSGETIAHDANRHERREATRVLWVAGVATREIARRLAEDDRVTSRDVAWLQAHGLADRRLP